VYIIPSFDDLHNALSSKTSLLLYYMFNNKLKSIKQWMDENKLKINLNKSQAIVINYPSY